MLTYKDGKLEPQKNDEVMGELEGKPARGRVLVVREKTVLVTRRAPYAGPGQPLASEHAEVDPSTLTLVYRPIPNGPVKAAPRADAAGAQAAAAKPAAKAAKKETVKK
jgi:hypothetical protein